MHALKLGIGFGVPVLALAAFLALASPPDDSRLLRGYMAASQVTYSEISLGLQKPKWFRSQSVDIQNLNAGTAKALVEQLKKPNCTLIVGFDLLGASDSDKVSGDITIRRMLTPSEILWVRLTHMGHDPFRHVRIAAHHGPPPGT